MTPTPSNMTIRNNKWINSDVQARIEPPPIPLLRETTRNTEETNIIRIKMHRGPESATSKTYELKVQTFKIFKSEEFLQMMKYFKTGIDGTGNTSASGKIQFLCTMLRGESLIEFEVIANQVGSTTNGHLKKSRCFLLRYFF